MSPRHSSATQHELARIGLLAAFPGEVLGKLAAAMEREALAPGEGVEGGGERFYAVLSGMLAAREPGGGRRVLRPGDTFDAIAPTVRALTPSVVASCDRATYDELVRPRLQLGEDGV